MIVKTSAERFAKLTETPLARRALWHYLNGLEDRVNELEAKLADKDTAPSRQDWAAQTARIRDVQSLHNTY